LKSALLLGRGAGPQALPPIGASPAALSPALARLVAAFMPGTSPDIAREEMLHTWQSFDGRILAAVGEGGARRFTE